VNLRVVSDNGTVMVVAHDPVPGALGFRLSSSASSHYSHTWDPLRTQHRFKSGCEWVRVEALMQGENARLPNPLIPSARSAPREQVPLDVVEDASRRSP
jgi:hypothetical protein